ncbi:PAS domain S-box protein [Verrucomicrobiota bacterium]
MADVRKKPGPKPDGEVCAAIMARTSDGIMVLDARAGVIFANRTMRRSYGFKGDGMVTLRDWMDAVAPGRATGRGIRDLVRRAKKNPRAQVGDFEIGPPGKRPVWCRFEVFRLPGGRVALRIHDITEARRQQVWLRLTLSAVDHAAISVAWVDEDGSFIYVNDHVCRLLGCTRRELLSMSVWDIDDNVSKDTWPGLWRRMKDEGSLVMESVHQKKSGETVPVELYVGVERFGGEEMGYAFALDLTDQRGAEQALRESEGKFRDLAEQSPNMIFINHRGRVVYANKSCEDLMGYARQEFYAEDFDFISLIADEDKVKIQQNLAQHMAGKEVPVYDYGLLTKDGKKIESVIATKLISYEGDKAILGIVTDVSDLRETQRQLEAAAGELSEQKEALEQKNVALKEILAQIEAEKLLMRRQIATGFDKTVMPILRGLKRGAVAADRKRLEVLEKSLRDMTDDIGPQAIHGVSSLTPKETEISNLVRGGMSTKEVADFLHISLRTVETHRNNIRRKLGLAKKRTNLTTYLRSLG